MRQPYPPGRQTAGREAIRAAYARLRARGARFPREEALPPVVNGDVALTSALAADGTGVRVQVLRRGDDGGWLRIIDRPESKQ